MQALIFQGKNKIEWTETNEPIIKKATDIIVKIEGFTFSHADYRPYWGHDNIVVPNTIMGHEGVGVVTANWKMMLQNLKLVIALQLDVLLIVIFVNDVNKKHLLIVLMVVLFW
ncbi:hypothetical protein [Spiroplasma endosymbiont of Poecilobothrus nobilitatus]|uniref:hypothetical protein n=1 Tax=Spiroplasma endosymbiont of Poecilobothrus nobilitatus TaxID=1209220 RepID=UPI00313E73F2